MEVPKAQARGVRCFQTARVFRAAVTASCDTDIPSGCYSPHRAQSAKYSAFVTCKDREAIGHMSSRGLNVPSSHQGITTSRTTSDNYMTQYYAQWMADQNNAHHPCPGMSYSYPQQPLSSSSPQSAAASCAGSRGPQDLRQAVRGTDGEDMLLEP